MNYTTVFDVSQSGYAAWWFPAAGLAFFLFCAIFVNRMRRLALAFTALWTILVFASTYADYRDAVAKLREGRYAIAEGPVTEFAKLPKGVWQMNQKAETFVVGGQRFTYHGAVVTAGFHQMASQGGPIHEGLQVRITYSGPDILRLEIAQ
jgi:hypothetical protein